MCKFQIKPILLACSLGLVVACSLGTSAHATLATGFYVSSAEPDAAVDSHNGANAWIVDAIPGLGGGSGATNGHDTSTANGSIPSGGIDDADSASWRITSDGFSLITATATFAAPLASSDFISLDFDPGVINFGGRVEVRFLDASDLVQASLIAYGGSSDFLFFDDSGVAPTSIPLSDDGFNLHFVDMGSGSFSLTVKDLGTAMTFPAILGDVADGPASTINKIQVFNQAAGAHSANSVYFNNLHLDIASTVAIPEASAYIAIPFAFCVTGIVVVLKRRNSPAA